MLVQDQGAGAAAKGSRTSSREYCRDGAASDECVEEGCGRARRVSSLD